MIDLGSFTTTAVLPLTGTPAAWTNPGPQTLAVVGAFAADACLSLTAEATPADFRLTAGDYARVRLDVGATLSVIGAEADAPAGAHARVTLAGDY